MNTREEIIAELRRRHRWLCITEWVILTLWFVVIAAGFKYLFF